MLAPLSIEFRRAVAALAVAELIAAGRREADALSIVASTHAGAAFPGDGVAQRIEAIRLYRAELSSQAPVEKPTRPLEIARYHYDRTRARLRAMGRDHGKSAVLLLSAVQSGAGD